jgi:hypothetical protein
MESMNWRMPRRSTPGLVIHSIGKWFATFRSRSQTSSPHRLWPLLALNFFMADMQSGIGPFLGVFLLGRGWDSGLIGTAMTFGNVAGMLITILIGGLIDTTNFKRAWVILPGICVVAGSALIFLSQNF